MNKTSTWYQIPDRIRAASVRLMSAQIENMNAIELIKQHDAAEVLIYADPPYVLDTRAGKLYAHEMTDAHQVGLLEALKAHPGPVLLSGYEHELYDDRLGHWHKEKKTAHAEKGLKRTEVLWLNPVAEKAMGGCRLFGEI